jgi:uncharacterized membrane protein
MVASVLKGLGGVEATATTTTTGLEPAFAGALAYLAGPFSGLIMLYAERTNACVRFHAWQAVIGLGGLGVLSVGLLFGAFAGLLLSPTLFKALYLMSAVTAGVWLVVWALCLVKAYQGHLWKLPWVGDIAERRATATAA